MKKHAFMPLKKRLFPAVLLAAGLLLPLCGVRTVLGADAASPAAPVAATPTAAAAGATPQPSPVMTPADVSALPPELHVAGNRLQTRTGRTVWLQGVSIDSTQWTPAGEHTLASVEAGVGQWKANVIRLPVTEVFWFGRGKGQTDGGAAYRALVDSAVAAAAGKKAYVVLDLHRFHAPMPEHAEFWKDAATRYKNHPAVLFELFNEPHGISWEIWRNGGRLADPKNKNKDENAAENAEKASGPVSTGMQALVEAVRSTGARNVVLAGGLDWGYDLTGVVNGFALDDPKGNGVMYVSHIYPWKGKWQDKVLVAADKVPVMVTEVGCSAKPMPWQKKTENPATWAPDVIGLIQKYRLNWTAFSFHPKCAPVMITDWNYTPSPAWGVYVKDALAGKPFEMKKMR